ncbi:MAG: type II toxin-antitoxin system HicB family antitoxin [Anaerolineae bacterium]|nr:type II toxin-antitoxin system HicB family antitoxin [Anaerolineae bacterium]
MKQLFSIRLNLEWNPGDVYTVTSPDVPGLVTEGSTPEEIARNVQDALEVLYEGWREFGIEPPEIFRAQALGYPQTVEMLVAADAVS